MFPGSLVQTYSLRAKTELLLCGIVSCSFAQGEEISAYMMRRLCVCVFSGVAVNRSRLVRRHRRRYYSLRRFLHEKVRRSRPFHASSSHEVTYCSRFILR